MASHGFVLLDVTPAFLINNQTINMWALLIWIYITESIQNCGWEGKAAFDSVFYDCFRMFVFYPSSCVCENSRSWLYKCILAYIDQVNANPSNKLFNVCIFSTDALRIRRSLFSSMLLFYKWMRFIYIYTRVLPVYSWTWYIVIFPDLGLFSENLARKADGVIRREPYLVRNFILPVF